MDQQLRNSKTPIEKLVASARAGIPWRQYPGIQIRQTYTADKSGILHILDLSHNLSLWIVEEQKRSTKLFKLTIFGMHPNRSQLLAGIRKSDGKFGASVILAKWADGSVLSNFVISEAKALEAINWAIFTYAGCDAWDVCFAYCRDKDGLRIQKVEKGKRKHEQQ